MHKQTKSFGFTIVELLIVVVVIAILAAITIVAYANFQNRAYDSAVKNDLSSAAKKLEVAKVDLGHYPRASSEMPTGFKFSRSAYLITSNNALYCFNHSRDEYALGAISKSGTGYMLTKSGIREGVTVTAVTVCGEVGTIWGGSPPEPRSTMHGFFPGGESPGYYDDGWNAGWGWTN